MARSVMFLSGSSFLLMLWLSISSLVFAKAEEMSGGDISSPPVCLNCSLCGSCHPKPPPPPAFVQYAPPPPPAQADCPPSTAVCCENSPPGPPQPYSDLPYYNYGASDPFLLPVLVFNFLSFAFLILLFFGVLF